MHHRLRRRLALVTASDGGLGLTVARALAAEGADVSLCGRDPDRLARAHVELSALGPGEVLSMPVDLQDEQAAAGWVRQTAEAFGGLDILVTGSDAGSDSDPGSGSGVVSVGHDPAAGHRHQAEHDAAGGHARPSEREQGVQVADYRAAIDAGLLPHLSFTLPALSLIKRRQGGRILMITPPACGCGFPTPASVTRTWLLGYAKGLVHMLHGSPVTLNVLAPGLDRTFVLAGTPGAAGEREAVRSAEGVRRAWKRDRIGGVAEYGDLAAFLATDQASLVTGTVFGGPPASFARPEVIKEPEPVEPPLPGLTAVPARSPSEPAAPPSSGCTMG